MENPLYEPAPRRYLKGTRLCFSNRLLTLVCGFCLLLRFLKIAIIVEAELGVGKGKKEDSVYVNKNELLDFAYNNKIILLKTYEVRGRGVGKTPLIFCKYSTIEMAYKPKDQFKTTKICFEPVFFEISLGLSRVVRSLCFLGLRLPPVQRI